ncbi:unnamed protein product [Brassica rapa subsp. trilocularis]
MRTATLPKYIIRTRCRNGNVFNDCPFSYRKLVMSIRLRSPVSI